MRPPVSADGPAFEPVRCTITNVADWSKTECVRAPRKITARKKKAARARQYFPPRPRPGRESLTETLWVSCAWPYTQRGVRTLAEERAARAAGFIPMIRTGVSRWPPLGCAGSPEAEIKDAGGRLFEARRNEGFFPRATSPYASAARTTQEQAPAPTAIGDLVRQNGYITPTAATAGAYQNGAPPTAGRISRADQVDLTGLNAFGVGLCENAEALGQRCLWPYTIASVSRLKKEGVEGHTWVRLDPKRKQSWPPLGCKLGPPPVTTWWILDFIRGFLGLRNPPLALQPAPVVPTAPRTVTTTAAGTESVPPSSAQLPPPPSFQAMACSYSWRWRGVGNPTTTYGPPVVDPEGRVIANQGDYLASPYVLVAFHPGDAVLCGVADLSSK